MTVTAISNAITKLRAQWALRFIDTATITRTTARGTYNAGTLQYDSPTEGSIYTGPALVRPGTADSTGFGEAQQEHHEYYVFVPHTATGVQPEDVVLVAVPGDADLDGEYLVVEEVTADSYITRRMLGCRLDQGRGNP